MCIYGLFMRKCSSTFINHMFINDFVLILPFSIWFLSENRVPPNWNGIKPHRLIKITKFWGINPPYIQRNPKSYNVRVTLPRTNSSFCGKQWENWPFPDHCPIIHIFPPKTMAGWWFQPLWKIWKSVGMDYSQYMESHKSHVPNHQLDGFFTSFSTLPSSKILSPLAPGRLFGLVCLRTTWRIGMAVEKSWSFIAIESSLLINFL